MSSVAPADSTVTFIRQKIRKLTASSGESSLTTAQIDQYINNFYNNDFPYGIKIDQMRSVYTFFTRPYIDRYPLDVNYNMGVRAPVYVEGIIGNLFKDRGSFYNLWPKFPTKFQIGTQVLNGTITGISQPSNPTLITSPAHGLSTGAVVAIDNVGGMVQLNGMSFTITVVDANNFTLNSVNNSPFNPYTGGGTWQSVSQSFNFNIPGPFLSKEVVIGGIDANGNAISLNDDGNGNILYIVPNPIQANPPINTYPAIPGMYNLNEMNPGLNNPNVIGSVDYVNGNISFALPMGISVASGTNLTVWVSQYQTGRPYQILFWNNEFTIRPVPKLIHKIEVETFLTPVQFMEANDRPILNQWAQYIAYGAAMEILRDRQDMEGVSNLNEGFLRQEALVLERQSVEEINQPNLTLFNSPQVNYVNGGWGQGWWSG